MEEFEFEVVFVQSKIPREVWQLRYQLQKIAEKEATKLYRLAWKMLDHGFSTEAINECREEARRLRTEITAYPERLWDSNIQWKYAFKY